MIPPVLSYWREIAARYVTAVCTQPDLEASQLGARPAAPSDAELDSLALVAPPMTGADYLTAVVLHDLWQELDNAFRRELSESKCGVQDFLKRRNPAWNLVGRVHFNLAENRKDEDAPFAFLATYTTRLSAHAKAQHLTFGQALREYAGAANKDRLLSPSSRAASGRELPAYNPNLAPPQASTEGLFQQTQALSLTTPVVNNRIVFGLPTTHPKQIAHKDSFESMQSGRTDP